MANRFYAEILVDGVPVFDSNLLNESIENGSISIDGQKLQGFENFIVEERRAKMSVRLLNQNQEFNTQIKSLFTDESTRLQDNLETINQRAIIFDYRKLKERTADSVLFKKELVEDEYSWNREEVFIPQSKEMLDIFYTMFENWEENNVKYQTERIPVEQLTTTEAHDFFHYAYKFKAEKTVNGYRFKNAYPQLLAFLARGLQINTGEPKDAPISEFISSLNSIFNNLSIAHNYLIPLRQYLSAIPWFTLNGVVSRTLSLEMLFYPVSFVARQGVAGGEAYYVSSINILDKIIQFFEQTNIEFDMSETRYTSFSQLNQNMKRAFFFASIISHTWFNQIKRELFDANTDANVCNVTGVPALSNVSYIPFFNAREVIQRRNFNHIEHGHSNLFWNILKSEQDIEFLKPIINPGSYAIRFGKPQRQTLSEETENGMPVSLTVFDFEQESYDEEGLFIPVVRAYQAHSNGFASIPAGLWAYNYMDNINFPELYGTQADNYMCITQYLNNNWMFFDNIKAIETYVPTIEFMDNYENGCTDLIPVYRPDESGQQTEYGFYLYKEFFNNFYIKKASTLTNICVKIYNFHNDELIYTGIVDYSSVTIDKFKISFSTTDAIGLLIENLSKLNEMVHFSQFNVSDSNVADMRAGTTVFHLMNYLTGVNMIPYWPNNAFQMSEMLKNDDINLPLKNKLLDRITPNESLIVAVQKSKKLLACSNDGKIELIQIDDVDEINIIRLDEEELISYSQGQGIDTEELKIDKLKLISGYENWLPEIVSAFSKYRYASRSTMSVEIFTETPIKILDKVRLFDKLWTVTSIEYGD
jgi:hypothetical protein